MANAPTKPELTDVLNKIIMRTTRLIEKRGVIKRDDEDHLQINLEEDDTFSRLRAGVATDRISIGPNKGKKDLTLKAVK